MTIATFNVNGIKARLPALLMWLEEFAPDAVVLQEIKSMDANFPRLEIEALGYAVETHGQKSFNGVAILSKVGLSAVSRGLPGDPEDEQARWIEGTIGEATAAETGIAPVRLCGLYLPNGNPITEDRKFGYKLRWMDRMLTHAQALRAADPDAATILAGDYNIIPADGDVYNPAAFADDALTQPESRSRYRQLLHSGWTDALGSLHPGPGVYTYWDYQAGAWPKDNGLRIDHLLLSPRAADRLEAAGVDRKPRGREKASDHTPVWIRLGK